VSTTLTRTQDGRWERIHGQGVIQTEEYRGWQIRIHWGGIEGRKWLAGVNLVDIDPARRDMVDRIQEANPNALQQQNQQRPQGCWVYTACEPYIYGNRPFNLAMVVRVRKAIDAWESKAERKFGVK